MNGNKLFYRKIEAFSLAEMVLILVFVAILALGSGIILPKKMKAKDPVVPHGRYFCTLINGQEHYFLTTNRNSEIPDITNPGWKQGNCQKNFTVPKYANILNVQMIGGGGAGKDASMVAEDEDSTPSAHLATHGEKYSVEVDGWYDINMWGQQGETTWRSTWNDGGCIARDANPGDVAAFSGQIQLKRGDVLQLQLEASTPNTRSNVFCSDGKYKPTESEYRKGNDGGMAYLLLNGSIIAAIKGSLAGTMVCNPIINECESRYVSTDGADGEITSLSSQITNVQKRLTPSGAIGSVKIDYSSRNDTSSSASTPTGGCGGSAGQTNATLYPVLRDTVPIIRIGQGGTPTRDATATIFGSFPASGGSRGGYCQTGLSKSQGSDGEASTALQKLPSNPGIGAKGSVLNGGNASGYGAGGGGGAAQSESSLGIGGNGSNGLLVITW